MTTPYGLIDGPTDYDFCEQSSRCVWINNKPVPYCSLPQNINNCPKDSTYRLTGCYNTEEECLTQLQLHKKTTLRPTTFHPKTTFHPRTTYRPHHIPPPISTTPPTTVFKNHMTIITPVPQCDSKKGNCDKKPEQSSKCVIL